MEFKHGEITGEVIRAFHHVYGVLGYGFLEKVYENALSHELRKRGLEATQKVEIKGNYDGVEVGKYFPDLMVAGCVIVEIKAAEALAEEHEAQLLNYLKATDIEVGLLLNFGPKPQSKRKIFETARRR